jgi:hypothetical protein
MSDDEEEMGAPSSDDSSCSADEKYDSDLSDWDILESCEPIFGGKDDDKYLTPFMAYIGNLMVKFINCSQV